MAHIRRYKSLKDFKLFPLRSGAVTRGAIERPRTETNSSRFEREGGSQPSFQSVTTIAVVQVVFSFFNDDKEAKTHRFLRPGSRRLLVDRFTSWRGSQATAVERTRNK